MKKMARKVREGAASFYVVAFSTMILVIIAASFAMVMVSEITRTSNDDLSQSAYDSALAGVEDAKLAFASYQRCLEQGVVAQAPVGGTNVECSDIVWWMEHPSCDMVAHILGRIPKDETGMPEVKIEDTVSGSSDKKTEINQAYTCVKIESGLTDYRATLSNANDVRVVKAEFKDDAEASAITHVRLSWYSTSATKNYSFGNVERERVTFKPAEGAAVVAPPTLEVQLIQTGTRFTLANFDEAHGDQTNRATVYLVPAKEGDAILNNTGESYISAFTAGRNLITKDQMVKTNDRSVNNKPFVVGCTTKAEQEFSCVATLELPKPIGGGQRNNDTFMITLALPYGQPDTDFAIEFCKDSGGADCTKTTLDPGVQTNNIVKVKNSQIRIDSTGRANDLYRRVETRLETSDDTFAYPQYALELLGGNNENMLQKDMTVTFEWGI